MNLRPVSALCLAALLGAVVVPGAWTPALAQDEVPELLRDYVPVTDEMLRDPDPADWITFRNGYAQWGYSTLDQINADTVGELRLIWSRAMRAGPQEVEPTVYDGVMFLVNSEDIVQALDATTGDLLWEYRRRLPAGIGNLTGTRYRYRNLAIYGDKVFLATTTRFSWPSTRGRATSCGRPGAPTTATRWPRRPAP